MDDKITIDKDMLNDLISFIKDCAFEGNSYASALIDKYKL